MSVTNPKGRSRRTSLLYPDYILHGYSKVKLTIGVRGCTLWYGEDKNYLIGRNYGDESGTYKIPDGAYYFRLQSYRMTNDPSATMINYILE